MTALNPAPEPDPAAEPPGTPGPQAGMDAETPARAVGSLVDWPALPSGTATRDPDVEVLLEQLGTLPALPVAVHAAVYARLHTDLLETLNDAGEAT